MSNFKGVIYGNHQFEIKDNSARKGLTAEVESRYRNDLELHNKIDSVKEELDKKDIKLENKLNEVNSRFDTLFDLRPGSTSGDLELYDIRVGFNGKTYKTAGSSVREQINYVLNEAEKDKQEIYNLLRTNTRPFVKTLLYYGYPSLIGGAGSPSVACSVYSSYDICIFGNEYEFPDHEEHANTVEVFNIMKLNYPNVKLVGYVPIGMDTSLDDSCLTMEEIKQRIDWWKVIGADGIFLDEFGFDYYITRERQNGAVGYCHDNSLFCICNAWEIGHVFGCDDIEIEWLDNFRPNPNNTPPLVNENDYYLFENLFYSAAMDWDKNVIINDETGCPIITSSNARRIDTISEYYNYVHNGEEESWYEMYGTKLMSLDAIPTSVSEKEMYRLRSMSVIGSVILGMDAVALCDENWGSSGNYYDWVIPSSVNLTRVRKGNTSILKSEHMYEFTYNDEIVQIGRNGGLRVLISESEDGENECEWMYSHTYLQEDGKWKVSLFGENKLISCNFISDEYADFVIDGATYHARRDTINSWKDTRYYMEWPSGWSANINEHIFTVVFGGQFAEDDVYYKDGYYVTMDGDKVQNVWQTTFGFQEYVYDALEIAENSESYVREATGMIEESEEQLNNIVEQAQATLSTVESELESAKIAQMRAESILENAMADLTMLADGFQFKEVQW